MTLYVAIKDGMQQANEFDLAHLAVDSNNRTNALAAGTMKWKPSASG